VQTSNSLEFSLSLLLDKLSFIIQIVDFYHGHVIGRHSFCLSESLMSCYGVGIST